MYRIEEQKEGASSSVVVSDYEPFRNWRDAVAEADALAVWRRSARRPAWRSRCVRVVDSDGTVVYEVAV